MYKICLSLLLTCSLAAQAANKVIVVPAANATTARQILLDLSDSAGQLLYKGVPIQTETEEVDAWYPVNFTCPTDAEGDPLHFELTIASTADFSTPVLIRDSRPTADGNSGWKVFTGSAFATLATTGVIAGYQGNTVAFVFQSAAITPGTLYYIRIRVHDGTAWSDYFGVIKSWYL